MEKATRNEMKTEAVRRMRAFEYYEPSIELFEKKDIVMTNEPPFSAHFIIDDEGDLKKRVEKIEERYNILVYAVIHSFTDFGELYNYLYVEQDKEEWGAFDVDCRFETFIAYVENVTHPEYSEFGGIGVQRTIAAGLKRVA